MLSDTDNSLRSLFLNTSRVTFEPGVKEREIHVRVSCDIGLAGKRHDGQTYQLSGTSQPSDN